MKQLPSIHKEARLISMDDKFTFAMSRLSRIQQEVIQRSYLDHEGEFDYICCGVKGIRDSNFRGIKRRVEDTGISTGFKENLYY